MSANQVNGVLRAVVPAVLAYAVGRGWIQQSDVNEIVAACVTLVSAAWSIYTNIEAKK